MASQIAAAVEAELSPTHKGSTGSHPSVSSASTPLSLPSRVLSRTDHPCPLGPSLLLAQAMDLLILSTDTSIHLSILSVLLPVLSPRSSLRSAVATQGGKRGRPTRARTGGGVTSLPELGVRANCSTTIDTITAHTNTDPPKPNKTARRTAQLTARKSNNQQFVGQGNKNNSNNKRKKAERNNSKKTKKWTYLPM